jgi:signal transduction histidine kinase
LAAEIFNIINEAAANAAKHAGGSQIDVDVRVGDETVTIIVQDDGRGFPFHGTYDLDMLDDLKRGPVTLKERVASLNGDLRLQTSSGGTRLEVTLAL